MSEEEQIASLEALLNDPQFFVTRAQDFPALEAKLNGARQRVAALYARWQELEAIKSNS